MRNLVKRKIRGLGDAALQELDQLCCNVVSVGQAQSRPFHFTLNFRCQQHGKYSCSLQYLDDVPDDLLKTDIKIKVLGQAFPVFPNGNGKAKPARRLSASSSQ